MSFGEVMGQEHVKQLLQNGLRRQAPSHAYIFQGPAGTGKRAMAHAFAQALLCEQGVDEACGTCVVCKKILGGNHPGLLTVRPDGASIKIDQLRALQRSFQYREAGQGARIYVIEEAHKMTTQAANSMLKFLEEPTAGLTAILITGNGQALLPTIRSRAQAVDFHPASAQSMEERLLADGYSLHLVRPAVRLRNGLEAARELIEWEPFAEIRNVMIQLELERSGGFAASSVAIQQKLVKTNLIQHLELLLDLWTLWFKDLLQVKLGRTERVVFADHLERLAEAAASRTADRWIQAIAHALQLRSRLRYPVNPQLALEQFMFQLQEE